jgi:hypothetical protein
MRPQAGATVHNGFLNRVSEVRFLPGAPTGVVLRVMPDVPAR